MKQNNYSKFFSKFASKFIDKRGIYYYFLNKGYSRPVVVKSTSKNNFNPEIFFNSKQAMRKGLSKF